MNNECYGEKLSRQREQSVPGESDTEDLTEKATFKPGLEKGQRMGVTENGELPCGSTRGKFQVREKATGSCSLPPINSEDFHFGEQLKATRAG